ncbi:cation/calcium exchanger 2 [Ziziphus jujuba]|uniref:Cation/calcium exchanger 2 n=1 Tax=Ziziphus jujuba TaxID=326968 RepID=A0A6P3Z6Z9_ZIZJJ|nr:cation/calcium exchanger 2 [Ziziphus jujuba]
MVFMVSVSEHKNYVLFLNISFLFVSCAFLVLHFYTPEDFLALSTNQNSPEINSSGKESCSSLNSLDDYKAKCFYLKSRDPCVSEGYINYLYLFCCNFGNFPLLGYFLLLLWLLVLFYLLGNTASEYFCPSLESLSKLLKLPPTIAGVTLLSLGNGAPDVFASLVSFMGGGTCEIGLNTVLGGASFVSCVVVGIISVSLRRRRIRINKPDFVRDVCFFLLVVVCLIVVLIRDEIDVWIAIAFLAMYILYVVLVYISHIRRRNDEEVTEGHANLSHSSDLTIPILQNMENGKLNQTEEGDVEERSEVEIKKSRFCLGSSTCYGTLLCILEMPLCLPRRLTIPIVCEDQWSQKYAVASVTLAPLLLSTIWNHEIENETFNTYLLVYGVALIFGLAFGALASVTTEKSSPPKKCLFPWVAAGFIMSITWSYITAQELVGLLVSLGYILGVSPSLLGLTVLAWGNSLGDLMTNLTMALKGGPEGAQIAFSGCYAGPIFNILFGLGLSLVSYSWSIYPSPIVMPKDPYLMQTLAFLGAGLLWALVVLPNRDMKLDGVFGGGLVVIYIVSLSLRLIQALGSLQHPHVNSNQY